jgi:transcriptional regulator GlxA family with amidase domain
MTAAPLGDPAGLDTLVVAGGDGSREAMRDPALLDFTRSAGTEARRVSSVCSGAYVLAAAGLLDGRRATTHWSLAEDFARRFPAVRLEPDRIWIRDGEVWTSAGITAGIDLALAMIEADLGEAVARRTAQQLVVYHRRPSGQSQFSALLELDAGAGRFAPLLAWMRENLAERLSVDRLADRAGMSERNFARAFLAETQLTPARAVERLRLEAARTGVEDGVRPIDLISRAAGFGDPERMRRAFVRAFGQPPQALRRAARGEAA